jgi:hypothetical protein
MVNSLGMSKADEAQTTTCRCAEASCESHASNSGQSGPLIDALEPNDKERSVAQFLLAHSPATLADIAAGCFSDPRGNSWARNSLRRLVRAGWTLNLNRGIYELTAVGKAALIRE